MSQDDKEYLFRPTNSRIKLRGTEKQTLLADDRVLVDCTKMALIPLEEYQSLVAAAAGYKELQALLAKARAKNKTSAEERRLKTGSKKTRAKIQAARRKKLAAQGGAQVVVDDVPREEQ